MSFERKADFVYITKNTTREELVDECRRLKNLVRQLRHKKKEHRKTKVSTRNKAVKLWKEKFNKASYQIFKKEQTIYGKDLHIERLRRKVHRVSKQKMKAGYDLAMKRISVNHYKVKHVANFLMQTNTVMGIYGLTFREYAFLLWAGRFDFFNRKEFRDTMGDIDINFYATVNRMMNRGYISIIGKTEKEGTRLFSLTGTGVSLYNKLAKFTNKFLKSDTGASSVRDNVQDAGYTKSST